MGKTSDLIENEESYFSLVVEESFKLKKQA
jgi:hypothetical protein